MNSEKKYGRYVECIERSDLALECTDLIPEGSEKVDAMMAGSVVPSILAWCEANNFTETHHHDDLSITYIHSLSLRDHQGFG